MNQQLTAESILETPMPNNQHNEAADSTRPTSQDAEKSTTNLRIVDEAADTNADPSAASAVIQTLMRLAQNIVSNGLKLFTDVQRDYESVVEKTQSLISDVSEQVDTIQTTIKATPRFKKIIATGLKMIASYRISELKRKNLSEEMAQAEHNRVHKVNAQRLYDLCIDLRGGVLKIGQFISCRQDLLPPAYIEALSELQDKVPAIPTSVIRARVEEELGPIDSIFQSFDDEPVAAASLAQVHKAVLLNGQEVAVKVRVPGIEDIVDIDLTAARSLAIMFKDMLPQIDLPTILKELKLSVQEELDYRIEVKNMDTFRTQHGHDENIIIPAIHHHLCTEKVLIMEFIEGVKLTDFLNEMTESGDEESLDKVLEVLIDSFCCQIMKHGMFHADPHPGNFLVTKDHKLAILDFGSVRTFDEPERMAYSELTTAIIMQDQDKMVLLLEAMHFGTKSGSADTLIEFADVFLGIFRENMGNDISSIDPREQMAQLMDALQKNPVVDVPGNFVMLGRVFAYLGGLIFYYKPRIHLFNILSPYVVMNQE